MNEDVRSITGYSPPHRSNPERIFQLQGTKCGFILGVKKSSGAPWFLGPMLYAPSTGCPLTARSDVSLKEGLALTRGDEQV